MGLLTDNLGIDDPNTAGLLSLGLRLMSTPGKFGTALGQAGLGAMGDMRQAQQINDLRQQRAEQMKQDALRQQVLEMQVAQARQAQAEQERARLQEEAFRKLIPNPGFQASQAALADGGGPTVTNAANVRPADPQQQMLYNAMVNGQIKPMEYITATAKDDAPVKLGEGETLFSGKASGYQRLAQGTPKASDTPSAIREYQFAVNQGFKGSFQEFQLQLKRAGAAGVQVSYGTPVQGIDANGNPVFIQPDKTGGAPAIIPGVRPPKSAAEERADAERATRDRQGQQMLSVMTDAEKILKKGTATGSGIGTVRDAVGRSVGVTFDSAQEAAKLQALSGWLVANVPRMEGPQSNFDVQNYMVMAGKIGDSTVPIPERLAALGTVRELQRRYAAINGTPFEDKPKPTMRWNPQTGRLEPVGG